jgi:hypothetical protein
LMMSAIFLRDMKKKLRACNKLRNVSSLNTQLFRMILSSCFRICIVNYNEGCGNIFPSFSKIFTVFLCAQRIYPAHSPLLPIPNKALLIIPTNIFSSKRFCERSIVCGLFSQFHLPVQPPAGLSRPFLSHCILYTPQLSLPPYLFSFFMISNLACFPSLYL